MGGFHLGRYARPGGALASRPGERRAGKRRPRGAHAAQLSAMGDVRPGGDVAGFDHRAAIHGGPGREHRLHRERFGSESAAVRDRRAMEGTLRRARTDGLRAAFHFAGRLRERRGATGVGGKVPAGPRRVAGRRALRDQRAGQHHLHLGHYRPAQRRHAEPLQHAEQRVRRAGCHSGARRRRDAVLPAAVAHLRAHLRLLPAGDVRRDGDLCAFHSAAVGRPAKRPSDHPDLRAAHLRTDLRRDQGQTGGEFAAQAFAVQSGGGSRLGAISARAGARRLEALVVAVAAAAKAGGAKDTRSARRKSAHRHQRRCGAGARDFAHVRRSGVAGGARLRAHRDQPHRVGQPSREQFS